jgi:2-dehydro-3-deoxyphosphooctonate aldolase (KDO 8-P synthase)
MPIDSAKTKEIRITENIRIGGGGPLFLIAGPCVIETEEQAVAVARSVKAICARLGIPYIFKASFDKANRSSVKSYRGPGLEKGLSILRRVKAEANVPVLSDVHETHQVGAAAEVLDIIQIPAFLCRQTDLIVEAARTKKPLNLKKGQFLSPQEMRNVLEKAESQGNGDVLLTERGTFFGYNNLVFDVRSIPVMKGWGRPVVLDATHIVQRPGGRGEASGGEAEFIPTMVRAGVAAGADGLFIEVHDHPEEALSDGDNSMKINDLESVLGTALRIRRAILESDAAARS